MRNAGRKLLPCALLLCQCLVDNQDYRDPRLAGQGRAEVLVPGGEYRIGDATFPVQDFYLDVFEVTVGAFRACWSAQACKEPGTSGEGASYTTYCNWTREPGERDNHPVNCVEWQQAYDFCSWAGRRLPREGEWEYAAAGEGRSTYPWGTEEPDTQLCWGKTSMDQGTCVVGSYGRTLLGVANGDGVADLAGNVWEWTGTEFERDFVWPEQLCSMIKPACSLRGASWGNDRADEFQTALHHGSMPSNNVDHRLGFRCARDF